MSDTGDWSDAIPGEWDDDLLAEPPDGDDHSAEALDPGSFEHLAYDAETHDVSLDAGVEPDLEVPGDTVSGVDGSDWFDAELPHDDWDDPGDTPGLEPAPDLQNGATADYVTAGADSAWLGDLGGADPSGEHHLEFHAIDLDEGTGALVDDDLGWVADSDADPSSWASPDLVDVDATDGPRGWTQGAAPLDPGTDGGAAVEALWARLAPGEDLPQGADGTADHGAALDELEFRARTPAERDVLQVSRGLIG